MKKDKYIEELQKLYEIAKKSENTIVALEILDRLRELD